MLIALNIMLESFHICSKKLNFSMFDSIIRLINIILVSKKLKIKPTIFLKIEIFNNMYFKNK